MPTTRDVAGLMAQECLGMRLRLVNRVVTGIYDESLRPLGLRVGQVNILAALAMLGASRPSDLGERFQIDPSTLTRNLNRMREQGWIEDDPEPDARAHPVRITGDGGRLLRRCLPAWQEAQAKVTELLGPGACDALHTAANRAGLTTGTDAED